jgi:hypothetical protein
VRGPDAGARAAPERYQLLHGMRAALNLINGSTVAGVIVARLGGARVQRGPDRLLIATGYRLPVPPAPAFTLGNVIVNRGGVMAASLFAHEARHATQYAWCAGVLMVPLYLVAAGASWVLCGDFGAWNVYERRAGLADGGYPSRPLRWARGAGEPLGPDGRELSETGRRAGGPSGDLPGGTPAGRAGSSATPSQ